MAKWGWVVAIIITVTAFAVIMVNIDGANARNSVRNDPCMWAELLDYDPTVEC